MSATIDTATLADLEARYPAAIRPRFGRQALYVLGIVLAVLYGFYCWWFFSIGVVLNKASSDIAGAYLADWISWEARPDIEIAPDGAMHVEYPRFSPLGQHPAPDWVVTEKAMMERTVGAEEGGTTVVAKKNANSFMVPGAKGTSAGGPAESAPDKPATSSFGFLTPGAKGTSVGDAPSSDAGMAPETTKEEIVTRAVVTMGSAGSLEILPDHVTARRGEEIFRVDLGPGRKVTPVGALPDWAIQKYAGEKVVVYYGFDGRAEIDYDGVKVRRRFLGWENFVFDTNSPFWGKSASEVFQMIVSGDRIEPDRSNLSLAINNILYNAEWQHLDVWTKLLQTIVMAFVGTLFAGIVAFPLAFIAARNITRNRLFNQITKRFFDFQRSVDMLIWALFFTRAFGPGPLAGISAIFFTDTGTLGKLYSEALENIDDRQREGVKSVGAASILVQRFGVLPQVLPVFLSQALYFWESNTRSATIIGAVGAGGIGLKLWEAMRTNQDWENVAYMVILILAVVYIFDTISNALRSRLVHGSDR